MQAILIRSVDVEDLWVSGFCVAIPNKIKTYAEALDLPVVKKAIAEYDWKKAVYAEKLISVNVSKLGVKITYNDGEDHEVTYEYDFIDIVQ